MAFSGYMNFTKSDFQTEKTIQISYCLRIFTKILFHISKGVYGYPYGGLYGYADPVVAPAKEVERKKREADPEADPEAEAAADAWYGYYGRPSYYGGWYGRGYGGYGGYYGGWGGYGLHGYRYGWGK